jgi:DNA-binding SARP family transcriptional activator
MEFRILGPLEVPSMDEAKLGGSRQPRTALGVLLLYANEVVAAERLAVALWGDDAPGHSVSRCRR